MCSTTARMTAINVDHEAAEVVFQLPSSVLSGGMTQQQSCKRQKMCDVNTDVAATGEDGAHADDKTSPSSPSSPSDSHFCAAGDTPLPGSNGWRELHVASMDGINADVTPPLLSSPASRKRKLSDVTAVGDELRTLNRELSVEASETQEPAGSECLVKPVTRDLDAADDDGYGNGSPDLDADYSEMPGSPSGRRTLYIEYWSRTDECKERKWDHLDEIADKYGSAEEHIFATSLHGIEHWTLWHVEDLSHEQIKQYVENWIDANAPHVQQWNYDDNPERSIDIFHVHVYLQVGVEESVLQGRLIDDLVHELD